MAEMMSDPEPENEEQRLWRQASKELGAMVDYVRSRYNLDNPHCAAVFQKQARSLQRTFFGRSKTADTTGLGLVARQPAQALRPSTSPGLQWRVVRDNRHGALERLPETMPPAAGVQCDRCGQHVIEMADQAGTRFLICADCARR